ncbi:serine/threonine-protein kinase [Acanthopleuribacter pedis]|uniref:Serine/threonine protein kinase n=1 Tax=Acanthopleuribacter pedis TaxID=442870 RepID=A0A8J7U7N7_9BACT|nr:serine/threonine-protein kinase [Acanthopleuribacter pedis]MBO1322723.1 serine/threonine protein kinase [Acanthopleuribacter pedis]
MPVTPKHQEIIAKLQATEGADLRAAYLAELCDHDPELMGLVSAQARDWLEHDSMPTMDDALDRKPIKPLEAGDLIGRYRVERQLGAGGMGRVYLAKRTDDVSYQVAVKVVSTGDPKVLRRFEKERRILAGFNHPHIAHIMDVGLTEQRLPWLAMEFVDGLPLNDFCNNNRLDIRDRLALFRKICDAVRYAHGKMVIHRDLKPSNIMVTHAGEPKLLDFGIATFLDPDTETPNTVTRFHEQVMTPSYASPEQIRGEELSTATDVYSLGIILYELLAGVKPYQIKSNSFNEWVEKVCLTEPARLGKVLQNNTLQTESETRDPIDFERIAFQRHTEISALRRNLRGDLETIVGKALRKEAADRYPSAEALAGDLGNYLDGMPISARPLTLGYRAYTFARRNLLPVSLTALLMMTMCVFGLINYQQRLVTERERDAANAVTEFLMTLFELSGPEKARGEQLTAVELLDRATRELEETLQDDPEIRARLVSMIAEVYQDLGAYNKALPLSREQLAIAREGKDPLVLVNALLQAANIYEEVGRYVESEQMCGEALAVCEKYLPDNLRERSRVLGQMGVVVRSQGQLKRALPIFEESLAVLRQSDDAPDEDLSTALNELAYLYHDLTRYAEAETYYKESLAIDRRVLGNDHPDTGTSLNNLAVLMLEMGRLPEAYVYMKESLDISEAILGEEHPLTAGTYRNMGRIIASQGNHQAAFDFMKRAAAIYHRDFDEHHILRMKIEVLLLGERLKLGLTDGLENDYRALFRSAEKRYEDTHIVVTDILYGLGELALSENNDANALKFFESALERHRLNKDFNNAKTGTYLIGLVKTHIAAGRWDLARTHAALATEQIFSKAPQHWQLAYLEVLNLQIDLARNKTEPNWQATLRDLKLRLTQTTGPRSAPVVLAAQLLGGDAAAVN